MLQQIILNTPLWVWALLAFLLYRGAIASTDREVALKKTLIVPLVMLVLSVQSTVSAFGLSAVTAPVWLLCFAAGAGLAWRWFDRAGSIPQPQRGTVWLRGSWQPMMLMMGIFLTKYAVGVLLALQPYRAQQTPFVAAICALYGGFSGIFIGKMLRILGAYRAVQSMAPRDAVLGEPAN